MTNLLVERAYTYVGRSLPDVFYYHQACWAKAAPDTYPSPTEEVVALARGTMRLVNGISIPSDTRCQQCGQGAQLLPATYQIITTQPQSRV